MKRKDVHNGGLAPEFESLVNHQQIQFYILCFFPVIALENLWIPLSQWPATVYWQGPGEIQFGKDSSSHLSECAQVTLVYTVDNS